MSSTDNLTGNILTAQMLETVKNLQIIIGSLEREREAIIGLHLRHLPNDLKAQVFERYDTEIANRRQELQDIQMNLAAKGYVA